MERHTESTQHLLSLEVSRLHPLIKASRNFLSSSGESSFQLHRLLWNRNQCERTTQLFLFRTCFQRKRNRVPGRRLLRQVQGSGLHNSHSSGRPRCVPAGRWIKKTRSLQTMAYHSASQSGRFCHLRLRGWTPGALGPGR